jgi:DNA gyrase/topoisomerase IV subunit A
LDERAAVPDVRDGLTTAGRCALWALHAAGTRNRGYVKSSRIVAVVDGAPRTLTLKQTIARWIEHRREVIARRPGATARSSTDVAVEIVKDELRAVAARCGDRRRTEIRIS